jgi:hypothetical protein
MHHPPFLAEQLSVGVPDEPLRAGEPGEDGDEAKPIAHCDVQEAAQHLAIAKQNDTFQAVRRERRKRPEQSR